LVIQEEKLLAIKVLLQAGQTQRSISSWFVNQL
jgi:hypothetical protein